MLTSFPSWSCCFFCCCSELLLLVSLLVGLPGRVHQVAAAAGEDEDGDQNQGAERHTNLHTPDLFGR